MKPVLIYYNLLKCQEVRNCKVSFGVILYLEGRLCNALLPMQALKILEKVESDFSRVSHVLNFLTCTYSWLVIAAMCNCGWLHLSQRFTFRRVYRKISKWKCRDLYLLRNKVENSF